MTLHPRRLVLTGVLLVLLLIAAYISLLKRPGCSATYWLNPDLTCRVLDTKQDGTYLLEYFNSDTNELRLYVQEHREDHEIEHPRGKVKDFKAVLSENQIKFNPDDDHTLVVNGEIFPTIPR
jgi:hypothetical protein